MRACGPRAYANFPRSIHRCALRAPPGHLSGMTSRPRQIELPKNRLRAHDERPFRRAGMGRTFDVIRLQDGFSIRPPDGQIRRPAPVLPGPAGDPLGIGHGFVRWPVHSQVDRHERMRASSSRSHYGGTTHRYAAKVNRTPSARTGT